MNPELGLPEGRIPPPRRVSFTWLSIRVDHRSCMAAEIALSTVIYYIQPRVTESRTISRVHTCQSHKHIDESQEAPKEHAVFRQGCRPSGEADTAIVTKLNFL